MKREREFYKSRNLPNPKDQPQNNEDDAFDRLNEPHVESDYHRQDEQVNVCLECMTNNLSALKRRFLRCSSQATITHLKKFVAKKVLNGIERYKEVKYNFVRISNLYNFYEKFHEQILIFLQSLFIFINLQVDILCNDELLGKDHTLKFVYITRWRFRDPPLRLQFRPRIEL